MIHRLSLAILILACAGCSKSGAAPEPATPAADPCAGEPGAGEGQPSASAAPTFAGWESWTKKTPARLLSEGHKKMWVETYVNETAEASYDAKQGPYPVGSQIVKPQYETEDAATAKNLTVMKKMPAGYDPEHGDWYYGVYNLDLTPVNEGKIGMCIGCHEQVADQDYVFATTE